MNVEKFSDLPILGILRGIEAEVVEPLVETVVSAGLQNIEITMNTPAAGQLIKTMIKAGRGRIDVGAGTVLSMDDLKCALDSGATFIVSPTLVIDVVEYCVSNNIPVFPGAFTPQEISNAWSAGATMVKVFPAKFFGPVYFKEIKGPFDNIKLLACGGVTPENMQSFFSCGASAVAFGASIFKKEWLEKRNFPLIGEKIKAFISGYSRQ